MIFEETLNIPSLINSNTIMVNYIPYIPQSIPCGDVENQGDYPYTLVLTNHLSMAWNIDKVNSLLHFQVAFLVPSI